MAPVPRNHTRSVALGVGVIVGARRSATAAAEQRPSLRGSSRGRSPHRRMRVNFSDADVHVGGVNFFREK